MRTLTLEEWRDRYCLSRRELAAKAGLHPLTIWRIEHGQRIPQPATRRRLAMALGWLDPAKIAWPQHAAQKVPEVVRELQKPGTKEPSAQRRERINI